MLDQLRMPLRAFSALSNRHILKLYRSAPPRRPGYTPAQPRPAVRPILLPEDYGSYANSPYTPYEPAQPPLPTPPDITYEELPPPSQDSVFYNSSVPHSHELLRPDASPSSPVSDFVPQSRAITGFPLVYEAEPVYGMQGETEADLDAIFQALDSDFAKFDHAYEKAQEYAVPLYLIDDAEVCAQTCREGGRSEFLGRCLRSSTDLVSSSHCFMRSAWSDALTGILRRITIFRERLCKLMRLRSQPRAHRCALFNIQVASPSHADVQTERGRD